MDTNENTSALTGTYTKRNVIIPVLLTQHLNWYLLTHKIKLFLVLPTPLRCSFNLSLFIIFKMIIFYKILKIKSLNLLLFLRKRFLYPTFSLKFICFDTFVCKSTTDKLKIQTSNSAEYRVLVHFLQTEKAECIRIRSKSYYYVANHYTLSSVINIRPHH